MKNKINLCILRGEGFFVKYNYNHLKGKPYRWSGLAFALSIITGEKSGKEYYGKEGNRS